MNPNPNFKYTYEGEEIEARYIQVRGGSGIIQPDQDYRALVYHGDTWNTAHIRWNPEQKEARLNKVDLDPPLFNLAYWIY